MNNSPYHAVGMVSNSTTWFEESFTPKALSIKHHCVSLITSLTFSMSISNNLINTNQASHEHTVPLSGLWNSISTCDLKSERQTWWLMPVIRMIGTERCSLIWCSYDPKWSDSIRVRERKDKVLGSSLHWLDSLDIRNSLCLIIGGIGAKLPLKVKCLLFMLRYFLTF